MQQRKSTLAYGSTTTTRGGAAPVSRRRRLDSRPTSEAPPAETPSSTPPSGLRLVQPVAVPRPKMSSIPPEPTSIRALMPRVALPRPPAVPRIVAPRLEDEVEALDDADLTVIEERVPPAPPPITRAPSPPIPWTSEATPIPANRTVPTTPPPRWIAPPAVAAPSVDDEDLTTLSPIGALRARALDAWAATSPRARTALTFAAGFVAGAIAVAMA